MFEHKHPIVRFVVFLWLLCAPTLIIGGMWGIFAGMVLIGLVKAVEKAVVGKR